MHASGVTGDQQCDFSPFMSALHEEIPGKIYLMIKLPCLDEASSPTPPPPPPPFFYWTVETAAFSP